MSYVTVLRNFLASAIPAVAVPSEVLDLADRFDALVEAGIDVAMSADSTGCCGEVIVVDSNSLDRLKAVLDEIRNPPVVKVSQSPADAEVEETCLVVIEVNSDDGLDDLRLGFASGVNSDDDDLDIVGRLNNGETIIDADTDVLIDRSRLSEAKVISVDVQYPNASKYGVPSMATVSGAEAMAVRLGFNCEKPTVYANDMGDDSGTYISITVAMPVSAVYPGYVDEVKEYAGLHWGKQFDSLSHDEKAELVNRFVQSVKQ